MNRVTIKQLEFKVALINQMTNSPATTYTKGDDGKFKANIGNYHLSEAYGGVQLVRMYNEGGGITVVSKDGYGTKRQLDSWMEAFIAGIRQASE